MNSDVIGEDHEPKLMFKLVYQLLYNMSRFRFCDCMIACVIQRDPADRIITLKYNM
jgi:hypothetical protein